MVTDQTRPALKAFQLLRCSAVFVFCAAVATATEFYVAPNGSPSGNGSMSAPWDLQTALYQPSAVKPGDTIWLRGGTYKGMFASYLKGAQNAPIIVRNYNGERATIDSASSATSGAALEVDGYWTWFWGIEVMDSYPVRQFSSTGSYGRVSGIEVYGANTKFINMVSHDNAGGFGFWQGADNSEIYGCLIYDNGFDGSDRGHGHSIYTQNHYTTKWIRDNIYFNAFSHGIHAYGSSAAWYDNYWIEGNIAFNNGILSWYGVTRNMLIGGDNVAQNETVLNNYTYFSPGLSGNNDGGMNTLGYDAGCNGLTANNNVWWAPWALILSCTNVNMSGNTFYGQISGFSSSQFPNNTYLSSRASGVNVYVRPNLYEAGRANIAVYNWDNRSSVAVDLSKVLNVGDNFEIRDAQDFYGTPVVNGTYTGAAVNVPMILTKVATPVGNVTVPPVHTPPEFGTFVVLRTSGTGTVQTNQAPVVSAGSNQTITLPSSVTLNGSATDDGLPSGTLTTTWSKLSGPGTVTFGNAASKSTTATFSTSGTYVLQLSATDGALTSTSTVTITVNPQPLTPPSTPTAVYINSGGSGYTDPQNVAWAADNGFAGGTAYSTANAIANTNSSPLYQTVRYGNFNYGIPVANGNYTVVLKFAEVYWTSAGQRVFNVGINGQTVLSNFDIVAQAGAAFKAVDKQFPVSVTNNQINIQFTSLRDNASVSGIAILPASTTPVAVSVTPTSATLSASQTQQFSATVANSANTAVTWSLSPATGAGTVSASGLYTAPATIGSSQNVTITATSAADPTKSASATITLSATAASTGFNPIRVNCGGPSYNDPQGRVWNADTGYNGGATYNTGMAVKGTTTPALYQTVRYLPLTYTFSVPNGTHTVTLKFGEIYFNAPGQRVFNVLLNGQTVLANFDIVSQAGAGTALDKQFTVSVTNGQITIQLAPVVENPMISAIEIQ